MALYMLGGDVSKWQGLMAWVQFKKAGGSWAIIRAGSIDSRTGVPYEDWQWDNNALGTKDLIPRGSYWYFRPNFSPQIQAEYWLNLIEGHDLELGLWIDIETAGGLSAAKAAESLLAFANILDDNFDGEVGIYTRASFWNYAIHLPLGHDVYKRALWIARYRPINQDDEPDLAGPWSDGRFKIPGWDVWRYWQFSADGNNRGPKYGGNSDDFDLDYAIAAPESPTTPDGIELPHSLALELFSVLEEELEMA